MHVIIVGAGNVGRPLLGLATQSGDDVVVIEQNETQAQAIANNYDCMVLNADATRRSTLKEAGADRADTLITTTQIDAINLFVCMLGSELDIPHISSVLHRIEHRKLFSKTGVNVVKSPYHLAANSLYRTAQQPPIKDYMTVQGGAEVFNIEVTDDAEIAGMTLEDARMNGVVPDDVLIVASVPVDSNEPQITSPTTSIDVGDTLTVYSERGADPAVTDIFGLFEEFR